MSLEFLSVGVAAGVGGSPGADRESPAIARSPMERKAKAAGARFEVRDGWNVAVDYASPPRETGWADVSHLRKLELQGGGVGGELRTARRDGEAWVCPLTPTRALIIGGGSGRNHVHREVSSQAPDDDVDAAADALDVTTCFAALTIFGPQAREVIARFCALDLRPQVAPPGSFRPGSIARQPGMILVEDTDRFVLLFGWAVGEYMWSVVEDAARSLGGGPVGIEALASVSEVPASA
jgi:glycine cleavage system aminomethyltransferase T